MGIFAGIGTFLVRIWRAWANQETLNVCLTAVLAYVTYLQFNTADETAIISARENFDRALDEAEELCGGCGCNGTCVGAPFDFSCSPSYLIEIPLAKAVYSETKIASRLTAVEYNRLAIIGSSIWKFDRTKEYVDKALHVRHKPYDPFDEFLSHLVMGNIYFRYLGDLPDVAKIETARQEFIEAIACLRKDSYSEIAHFYTGYGYAIWAAHEQFLGHKTESKQKHDLAVAWWKKLDNEKDLTDALNRMIERAGGEYPRRPEISCLFKGIARVRVAPRAPPAPAPEPAPTGAFDIPPAAMPTEPTAAQRPAGQPTFAPAAPAPAPK